MRFFSQSFLYDDSWSIVALAFFLRYPNPYASHVISCDVIALSRAESWVIEESEVDPYGKVVRCVTKNLDHVKVMQVEESVCFAQNAEGIVSRFGWGLTKKIENHGLSRFKANMQRSREGVSLILSLLRQSRLQPMTLGLESAQTGLQVESKPEVSERERRTTVWSKFKTWLHPPPPQE
ncbi:hypothetical protein M413DRAFT_439616 [Hebeloma cylindrosporum]|uniref:PRELI/MSF1 domain-containing protein n=1 Tax=Hebeloma cylindrosporum TaxID=76867 RepID=A0A0C2YDP1_HEBCY|nr:hypothetical protein M413DRAFT_439616 [Hebeloma cylindrosporum h7]